MYVFLGLEAEERQESPWRSGSPSLSIGLIDGILSLFKPTNSFVEYRTKGHELSLMIKYYEPMLNRNNFKTQHDSLFHFGMKQFDAITCKFIL